MANANQPWWSMPLPAGWEAKFDSKNNRYFFINHRSQQTTWEDPRQAIWQSQQAGGGSGAGLPYAVSGATAAGAGTHRPSHLTASNVRQHGGSSSPRGSQTLSPSSRPSPGGTQRATTPQRRSVSPGRSPAPSYASAASSRSTATTRVTSPPRGGSTSATSRARSPGGARAHSGSGGEHIPMTELKPLWQKQSDQQTQETSLNEQYERLQIKFPFAEADIIKSLINDARLTEVQVGNKLAAMGYKVSDPLTIARITAHINQLKRNNPHMDEKAFQEAVLSSHFDDKKPSASESSTPAGPKQPHATTTATAAAAASSNSRANTPQKQPAPATDKLAQLKQQLRADYPTQTAPVIDMALRVCLYDETRTRALLDRYIADDSSASRTAHNKQPIGSTSSASSSASTATGTSLDTALSLPSSQARRSTSDSPRDSPSRPTTTAQAKSPTRGRSAKSTTSSGSYNRTAASGAASTACGSSGSYHSVYRTQACGPNKHLPHGPNKDLLLESYIPTSGADPSLSQGTCTGLAVGHDPALVQGSDPTLVAGPTAAHATALHAPRPTPVTAL